MARCSLSSLMPWLIALSDASWGRAKGTITFVHVSDFFLPADLVGDPCLFLFGDIPFGFCVV